MHQEAITSNGSPKSMAFSQAWAPYQGQHVLKSMPTHPTLKCQKCVVLAIRKGLPVEVKLVRGFGRAWHSLDLVVPFLVQPAHPQNKNTPVLDSGQFDPN